MRREETRTRDASEDYCAPGNTSLTVAQWENATTPIPRPGKDRSFKKDRGKQVVETKTRDLKT